jgi:hypothetical protein
VLSGPSKLWLRLRLREHQDRPLGSFRDVRVVGPVALLVLGLIVGGVWVHERSSSQSAVTTHTSLDACRVFAMSDAQQLFGSNAIVGGHIGLLGNCSYTDANQRGSGRLIALDLFRGQPPSVADSYEQGPVSDTAVDVPGAHARWYFYGRDAAGVLDVHRGRYVLRVAVGQTHDDRAVATAVAKVILPRLPAR